MPYYFIDHNGEKSLIEKENDKNTIYYYEAPNKEKDYYYEEDGLVHLNEKITVGEYIINIYFLHNNRKSWNWTFIGDVIFKPKNPDLHKLLYAYKPNRIEMDTGRHLTEVWYQKNIRFQYKLKTLDMDLNPWLQNVVLEIMDNYRARFFPTDIWENEREKDLKKELEEFVSEKTEEYNKFIKEQLKKNKA